MFFWGLFVLNWSALGFASDKGDIEMVKVLLGFQGINPNVQCGDMSPQQLAESKGTYDIVKLLLSAQGIGANLVTSDANPESLKS
jgi:ankyrin repeat protein